MSKKTYHVYSKMAASVAYNDFVKGGADLPVKAMSVTIKGGAGIANNHIITPLGVHNEVSEEEITMLKSNGIFQLHEKAGFIKVEERKADIEKVVADMTEDADPSSPLTPADYADAGDNDAAPSGVKGAAPSGGKKK